MNMQSDIRREAIESRERVNDMLRDIQDLALQIRTDIAISEQPKVLLMETHRILNLVGQINTHIRGYGRHWL